MPASGKRAAGNEDAPEIRVSITLLMLFLTAALFIRSFVQIRLVGAGYDPVTAKHLSALVGFVILGILMWPTVARVWPALRMLFRRPASWGRMLLASFALGIVVWLGQALALLAFSIRDWITQGPYEYHSWPEIYFACSDPMILYLAIPVMSVITPIIEEVIDRGMILHTLLPKGRLVAIFASAVAFAIFHGPDAIPFAFIFGLIVAMQMLHYRTLWAVIVTHGTANLLTEFSRNCIDGFWFPGKISWGIFSPAPLLIFSLAGCLGITWWLAARFNTGTEHKVSRPESN